MRRSAARSALPQAHRPARPLTSRRPRISPQAESGDRRGAPRGFRSHRSAPQASTPRVRRSKKQPASPQTPPHVPFKASPRSAYPRGIAALARAAQARPLRTKTVLRRFLCRALPPPKQANPAIPAAKTPAFGYAAARRIDKGGFHRSMKSPRKPISPAGAQPYPWVTCSHCPPALRTRTHSQSS